MHLLLIEDNTTIATNIVQYLQLEGRSADHCTDGISGLKQALNHTYDCIMLDVMLPGMDGFELLAQLRQKKQTPVIMTTAKGQLDDKTTGFAGGADDYLVKPFALEELVMRLRAVTKRSDVSDIRRREQIEVDLDANTVSVSGEIIGLTLKERQILILLIDAYGAVVQRTTIIDELRGDTGIRDDSNDAKLDVYISNLRKKLDKKLILTVKGVGYKLSRDR